MNIFARIKNMVTPNWTRPELLGGASVLTTSGQYVSVETAKKISTYFRCLNTITDDLSIIPFQQIIKKTPIDIVRVQPDSLNWNYPYSMEICANPYQNPFVVMRRFWRDLLETGDNYLWTPFGTRYLYTLNPNETNYDFRRDGSLWFVTSDNNGKEQVIPAVEVVHLSINPINAFKGRGILAYARDTLGTRQAGNVTRSSMFKRGLMPSAIAEFEGDMSAAARQKVRDSYWEAVSGADQAGGVVVLDGKVRKFSLAEIKPADAQFLESIDATDADIANFFSFPLHKLNLGKQSYESNDQQDDEYLRSTLDPYLVQMEKEARIKWIARRDQVISYWKYNRDAFLRMDSKTRADYLKSKILSGQYTPNQALEIDDLPGYLGGNVHYIPSNMAVIHEDGTIESLSKSTGQQDGNQEDGSQNGL